MKLLAATVAFWLGGLTMLVIQQPGIGSMIGDMAMNIDPEDMAYNVREIMIHGGFEKIQDVLKQNLMVKSEPQKQKAYMLKILKLLDEHFISNMDLVEEMCKEIHKTYLNFPKKSEIPKCGDFPGNFYGQMDKSTMCQLVPAAARRDPSTTYLPRSVMLNLIHHYHMSNSKGQMYISTTDGILYLYPAVRLPDNAENPRFRPWYGDAVSQPKYILLAIDVSITVWPFFNVSKEVARIFINSSNPRDHITVIGYSANHFVTPRKMGFCFDRYKLAKATLPSQALLQKFVEALSINGSSHYETALEKIFSFINQPVDHGYKDHYVVLISGGPSNQTKAEVIQSIRSKMTSVSRLVKFVTIDLGSHKSDILKGIGDEFGTYISSDGVKLPYDYFQRFINAYIRNNKSLIMTPAFIDSITGDVVCSMPQPIFVEDRLVAVAATEVNLNKIFYEIKYLDSNAQSYMFLIDRFGLTAYHPHLPRLELFVPIGDIEKEAQEHGVIDSMLRGESGQKAFMVKDIISIGKHRMHGIETVLINTTFMWQSLRHTEFSICSVLGHIGNIMSSRYKIDRPVPAVPFIYHDDIIHNNGIHKCKYFRRAVTKDRSTVKFSGKAFQDPFKYLNDEESPIKTQLYKEVIKGHPRLNIFKEGVVESVNITSVVDKEWVDKAPYAIWRVLTTATGVTRIYPGITEKRYYLPVERSWYIHSTWKPGNTIVSSPYLKRWAGGFIITLSKALTTHMHSGDRSLVVFGALKIDVFAEYLYTVLLGSYPMCHSTWSHCFVVDETGYIVIHPDFIVPPNSPTTIPRIDQIHIIQKEPRIAEKLIKHRVMERVTCFELKHLALFHSYKMKKGVMIAEQDAMSKQIRIEIYHIPNTNLFIIAKAQKAETYDFEEALCHCPQSGESEIPRCTRDPRKNCDCPCVETVTYDMCNGSMSNLPLCTPLEASYYTRESLVEGEAELLRNLAPCDVPKCRSKTTLNDCHLLAECRWCSVTAEGTALGSKAFCGKRQDCYFGMVGHYGIFNDGAAFPIQATWQLLAMISVIMVTSVVIILVIVLGHLWVSRYKHHAGQPGVDAVLESSSPVLRQDPPSHEVYGGRMIRPCSTDFHKLSMLEESITSGFYGPHSRPVLESIQSLHRITWLPSRSIKQLQTSQGHQNLAGALDSNTVQNWSPYIIQKSDSTIELVEEHRRALVRKQQLRNMVPGQYSRHDSLQSGKLKYNASLVDMRFRLRMNTVIKELSEKHSKPTARKANDIDDASSDNN